MQNEQQIRQIGERLVRTINPEEQRRLKAELVRYILEARPSRQQYELRELTAVR
jgi:hypothetical protein